MDIIRHRLTNRRGQFKYAQRNAGAVRSRAKLNARKHRGKMNWLLEEYCGLCAYCSTPLGAYEIDHIQSISTGGNDDRDNLVPVCRRCNAQKGSKSLLLFLANRTDRAGQYLRRFA